MPTVTRMSYSPRGLGRSHPLIRSVSTKTRPSPTSLAVQSRHPEAPTHTPAYASSFYSPARAMTGWDVWGPSLMLQTAMNVSSSMALAAQARSFQQQPQQQAFMFSPNLPPLGPMGSLANFAIPVPEQQPPLPEPEKRNPNPATEGQLKKIGIKDKEAKRLHQLLNGEKPDKIVYACKLLGGQYVLATENARVFKGKANNLKEIAASETLRTKCLDQTRVLQTEDGLHIALQLNPQDDHFTGKLQQKWLGFSLPALQRQTYKL